MRVIYKYEIPLQDLQTIRLPQGAVFLDAQMQNLGIVAWYIVHDDAPAIPVEFRIVGTGHPVPMQEHKGTYLATVQVKDFVWHIFSRDHKNGVVG